MEENFTLQLLHASDLEGGVDAIGSAPNFAAIESALEAEFANTITISAGDNYISGPFFNASSDPVTFNPVFEGLYNEFFGLVDTSGLPEDADTNGDGFLDNGEIDAAIVASDALTASDVYVTDINGDGFPDYFDEIDNFQGRVDISIMNLIGFDASALGNHEFDLGTANIEDIVQYDSEEGNSLSGVDEESILAEFPDAVNFLQEVDWAGVQFPYLSSNLIFEADPEIGSLFTDEILPSEAFESDLLSARVNPDDPAETGDDANDDKIAPSTIVDVNGEAIGVVGATTPLLESISSPGLVEVLPASDLIADLATIIQAEVDELLAVDADGDGAADVNKVIVASHLQEFGLESEELAPLLSGVDIIVAGGSDTILADSEDVERGLQPGDEPDIDGYPFFATGADGNPIAVVNTSGEYSYVGRLVIEFDESGVIIPESVDPAVSGAFATTDAGVIAEFNEDGALSDEDALAAAFAEGTAAETVQALVSTVTGVVIDQDGNIVGQSDVFQNGARADVRNQETNFGNLTADANIAAARLVEDEATSPVLVSLKNGGGIRDIIGFEGQLDDGTFVKTTTMPNPDAGKEMGDVSELDIGNTLRFNNGLVLVTLTPEQLLEMLEHGVAEAVPDLTTEPGQFSQVGGLAFSFDPTQPAREFDPETLEQTVAGERVQSVALIDEAGEFIQTVVEDGEIVEGAPEAIRVVTLDFLEGGGDAYPFPVFEEADPDFYNFVSLEESLAGMDGAFTFADAGSEQDALAEFYFDNFNVDNGGEPYADVDTPIEEDTRIQNVEFREDTVLEAADGPGAPVDGPDDPDGPIDDPAVPGEVIEGTDGDDEIEGTAGDDTLLGLAGGDTLLGLAGDDTLLGGGGSDVTDGGDGSDTADFSDIGFDVVASLPQGTASYVVEPAGVTAVDFLVSIENLTGSANDDQLFGDGGDNVLDGGDGDDLVVAGGGADILSGGPGDDTLQGGGGPDALDGGEGSDTAGFGDLPFEIEASLETGEASYINAAGDTVTDSLAGIENLSGSAEDDALTGDAGDNLLAGNIGDDLLVGGDGDDLLRGDAIGAGTAILVEMTNPSPEGGLFLTPVWFGFHDGSFDVLTEGEPATEGLERLAEDGTVQSISAEFVSAQSDLGGVDGTVFGFDAAPGPLDPGETASLVLDVTDPSVARFLTFATMVIPSNDAFVAAEDDPMAMEVFDEDGNFLGPMEIVRAGADVLDAGTEINTETEAAFLNQTALDAGESEGGAVMAHPGFNGSVANPDGTPVNILGGTTAAGTVVDPVLGDFTVDGGSPELLQIRLSLLDAAGGADVLEGGAGNDTLDGGAGDDTLIGGDGIDTADFSGLDTDGVSGITASLADGTATLGTGFDLTVEGMPLTDLAGSDGFTDEALLAELLAGNGYINVHTAENPSGEIRGQLSVVSSEDGVVTLEGVVEGEQEVITIDGVDMPNPVDTEAEGFGTLIIDTNTGTYDFVLSVDSLDPSRLLDVGGPAIDSPVHIHIAPPGMNGPIPLNVGGDGVGVFALDVDTDSLDGIENLSGTASADSLTGDDGANLLKGGAGDDLLVGGAGDDTLDGGEGVDTASFSDLDEGFGVTASLVDGTAGFTAAAGDLDFIGEQGIDTGTIFGGTEIGGLSGIELDPASGTYFAISDDQSTINLARFYNLALGFDADSFDSVTFNAATTLLDVDDAAFAETTLDPESIRLTPEGNLLWVSEGNVGTLIDPFVREMTVAGEFIREFELPEGFSPTEDGSSGIRDNLAFESLTITPDGDTVFAANENALLQDGPAASLEEGSPTRVVQYDFASGEVTGQFIYVTEPIPEEPIPEGEFATNGLVELLALDDTSFIALERAFSVGQGNTIQLFLTTIDGATDVDGLTSIEGEDVTPMTKVLLADLADFGIEPDNIEGISFGPELADGRQSLVLVSDNNFSDTQFTQFLTFGVDGEIELVSMADELIGIENLTGTSFDDTLIGDDGANVLDGVDGDDVLKGGAGADTLLGGLGDDLLTGGGGGDSLDGGEGTDTASFADIGFDVTANLSSGQAAYITPGGVVSDTLSSIENLTGSANDDILIGDDGDNVLDGNGGSDVLIGNGGDDTAVIAGSIDDFEITTVGGTSVIVGAGGEITTVEVETLSFDDASIAGIDAGPTEAAIFEIQGAGHVSTFGEVVETEDGELDFIGEEVTTTGIVTAIDSNGFFLQDAEGDGDDTTSDGIFVFTGDEPSVAVGDEAAVVGTVDEFVPGGFDTNNLSTTQIVADSTEVLSSGNVLPAAALLGLGGRPVPNVTVISEDEAPEIGALDLRDPADGNTGFDPAEDGIDFFETVEGMRVTVEDPVAVSATNQFGETWTLTNGGSAEVIEPDEARTVRDGIPAGINLAAEADGFGDLNPERVQLQFDSGVLPEGLDPADISNGDTLSHVTGVVGYSFGNFEVLITEPFEVTPSGITPEVTELVPTEDQLTVVAYNILNVTGNLDDDDADGDDLDADQIAQIAEQLVSNLGSPDIVALQEVQDDSGETDDGTLDATGTLETIVAAIEAAGGPAYEFVGAEVDEDGETGGVPGGNIRNAFLYNPERVDSFVGLTLEVEELDDLGVTDPTTFDGTRDPLLGLAEFNGEEIILLNNHLTSRFGSSPIFGAEQLFTQAGEEEREAETGALNEVVDTFLGADPDANIVVLGDLNTFEFTNDLTEILPGTGEDQVLTNLITDALTEDDAYTFIFQGNSQVLDHIFVTDGLLEVAEADVVHVNNDFPFLSEQVASDHEPVVARFTLPGSEMADDMLVA